MIPYPVTEKGSEPLQPGIYLVRSSLQRPERGETGCYADRVAAEGSGLVHGSQGCKLPHYLSSPSKGRQWESSPDNLPEYCQVRDDMIVLLGSSKRQSESGNPLIKDQDNAVLSG